MSLGPRRESRGGGQTRERAAASSEGDSLRERLAGGEHAGARGSGGAGGACAGGGAACCHLPQALCAGLGRERWALRDGRASAPLNLPALEFQHVLKASAFKMSVAPLKAL